jgi:hypothetical protein
MTDEKVTAPPAASSFHICATCETTYRCTDLEHCCGPLLPLSDLENKIVDIIEGSGLHPTKVAQLCRLYLNAVAAARAEDRR